MNFLKLNQGSLKTEIVNSDDYVSSLKCLQDIVGGWICDATRYFDLPKGIVAYVNDEGLLKPGFEPTVITAFSVLNGKKIENSPLVGNIAFGRVDEMGEDVELSDKDIEDIRKMLDSYPEITVEWNGEKVTCLYNYYFVFD